MNNNRKYCLLVLFSWCQVLFAQQRTVDSLQALIQAHPARDTIRLGLLNDLGWSCIHVDASKGLEIANEAIALGKELGGGNRLASAYNTLAWNYSSLGHDSEAIAVFRQGLAIREQMKDSTGIAKLRYNIGIMFFNLSDYPQALEYQQGALAFFEKKNDSARMANCYNAIGLTYQYVSDYPKALDCYLKTLAINERMGVTHAIAPTLTNIGILYKNMNDLDRALEYQQKALKLYQETGDQQGMANCLGNIGVVYSDLGQHQQALSYYRQALALCRTIGFQSGVGSHLSNIGSLFISLNDYGQALDTLNRALLIWRQLGDKNNESEVMDEIAKVYSEAPSSILTKRGIDPSRRYQLAHELLDRSLGLARDIQSPGRQEMAWQYLSELYQKEKDYAGALHAFQQSIIFHDSVSNTERAKDITRKEMQFDFEKKQAILRAENANKQALATAEINRQRVVKNSILAGVGILFLAALSVFIFYKKRRDAEYERKDAELRAGMAETEMKALRAQMNPHFIFNSLNSISDFISKNDIKAADSYLTRFSQLMRLILENSEWMEVPLAGDLRALETYIQLERLRLDNRFSYEIRVDPSVDKELTLVPPLILQPFVENSIWHGVAKKEGDGTILVHIWQTDGQLHCVVEDNGPGRTKNGSATAVGSRRSLGQKITAARIDMINRLKKSHASVEMTDLEQGLRIEVILPLELRF